MTLSELMRFAERRTGALINIDALHEGFYACAALELAPDQHVHRGSFCEFAKRHSSGRRSCHASKRRSRRLAARRGPYEAVCPHGIRELVWPVFWEGRHVATIYLGHFRSDRLSCRLGTGDYDGPALRSWASADIAELRRFAGLIAEFAWVALALWQEQGGGQGKHRPGAFYADTCRAYIDGQYRESVQLRDLALALRVSPNYLSARINAQCGRSFSQLLRDKRLAVARTYLEFHPELRITAIAYLCGFRDSNYFSTVFRRRFGLSPRAYRKRFVRCNGD